jgi:hypothetical protein
VSSQLSQTAARGRNRLREATGESSLAPPTPPLPHRRTHPEPSLSHPEAYSQRGYAGRPDRQSSSASRVTAGAVGFFTLIQFALRPER